MPISITSQVEGFRRCGMAHPRRATEYADDHFTVPQLMTLRAEPMLTVVVSPPGSAGPADARQLAMYMTVAQLTERLTALKVEAPKGAKKADLVELWLAAADYSDGGSEA